MVHLCYSCTKLSLGMGRGMGLVYTHVVHIIAEFTVEGCTTTLFMHVWSHTWFNPSPFNTLMRLGRGT